MTYKNS